MAIFPLVLKKFPAFCKQNILRTCAPSWSVRKSLCSLTNSLSVYTDKLKQVKQGIPNPWKKMLLVFSQIKKTQPTKRSKTVCLFYFFPFFESLPFLCKHINCKDESCCTTETMLHITKKAYNTTVNKQTKKVFLCTLWNAMLHKLMKARFCLIKISWLK